MSRVILFDLPEDLGIRLASVLMAESHQVSRKRYLADLARGANFSAVFISGDSPDFRQTLSRLRESYADLPVIVVSRHPDARQWLDALDGGATDYCGAPFERVQIRWIMGSIQAQTPAPSAPWTGPVLSAVGR